MSNMTTLGSDDKHVLTSAIQTFDGDRETLVGHLTALLGVHSDTARVLEDIETEMRAIRPILVINTSPDRWYTDFEGTETLDQVWDLTDKYRRQVELLDAVRRVCRRLSSKTLISAA